LQRASAATRRAFIACACDEHRRAPTQRWL